MKQRPDHEKWMRSALRLAARGIGRTSPNPPVGAVVVRNGQVAGSGWHCRAGMPHAEVEAMRDAGAACRGATLYVTLEPCCTWGRTPPCTGAIIENGIKHVVVGAVDPNPRHAGKGLKLLRRAGIEVTDGICRDDAERLIAPFAHWITTGMPYVTLKLGVSLDGRIADRVGKSRWITGPESRAEVQRMRSNADAVMVGIGTAIADDPSLLPEDPDARERVCRVIVDSRGRLPLSAKVLSDGKAEQTIVAVSAKCQEHRRAAYRATGAKVVVAGAGPRVSLRTLFRKLGRDGMLHILAEGGGELAASLIGEGLADEVALFIAPLALGGGAGGSSVRGRGWALEAAPRFVVRNIKPFGQDVRITMSPTRGRRPTKVPVALRRGVSKRYARETHESREMK